MTDSVFFDQRRGAAPQEPVSLLWPPGCRPGQPAARRLTPEAMEDLDFEEIVRALAGDGQRRASFVREALAGLCQDPQVIAFRAAVVTDLLEDPELRRRLAAALPGLQALIEANRPPPAEWVVQRVVQRLNELALYSAAVEQLQRALEGSGVRAPALQALRAHLQALAGTPAFTALQAELPALRGALAQAASVTVGINLSEDLLPESAAILGLGADKIAGRRVLLERLLGGGGAGQGLTPLRAVQDGPPPLYGEQTTLARDLRRLLERVVAPVRQALDRYLAVQTQTLHALEPEIAFLLGGVALIERLRGAGLPMCRPESAPPEERGGELSEAYNLSLALRLLGASSGTLPAEVVTNPMAFDAARGRVWILTGPNRSGKTIYTRAVGQAQVLFQAGLYVPARSARLSPVDAIYTHFPTPERAQPGMGRLDEEAARLAAIFRRAGPQSLILLNEVLAGTSGAEALGLAVDAVRGLRLLGARAVYVTHLHELAGRIEEINAQTPGDGTVGSLVAEVEEDKGEGGPRRTFRIRPGAPSGASYASAVAEQHGITFPQLVGLFRQRRLLPEGEATARPDRSPAL